MPSNAHCCEDLRRERAGCSFNTEELTNIVDGGVECTRQRRRVDEILLSDPELRDPIPPDYLSHADRYSNEMRKSTHLMKTMNEKGLTIRDLMEGTHGMSLLRDGNPLSLHITMFLGTIRGQASPEQLERWQPLIEKFQIIGSYAQTELGHGTFIRGLEITATYDPNTQEFILHSPTISATKWWPGGLGKTCNYAVVMAQLYLRGKCYGPHPFMVQLRDLDTHRTLPGLTLGEIGPRLGLNTNDNGFLRFNNHRIPRNNMFMKHCQVTENGEYVHPIHSKLSYGVMVHARVGIVRGMNKQLMKGVTIATRYSAVRHQSEIVPGEPEPQILDYQTQQYKLLPYIASVFANLFVSRALVDIYSNAVNKLERGNVDLISELHAISSGLKAMVSNDATLGVETCRLACGGHGYLGSSGLPVLYTGTTCGITYEGENTVLFLQVARYLVKSYRTLSAGQTVHPSVSYLSAQPASSHAPPLSNQELVSALGKGARWLVSDVVKRLQQLGQAGQQPHDAWNASSVFLVKAAEAHTRYYICEKFVEGVSSVSDVASPGVCRVLGELCRLYLLHHTSLNAGLVIRCGALSSSSVGEVENEMCEVLGKLRSQAVPLVDAFDIPDAFLTSTLGAWDGNVYQRLFDEALKSPLNKTDVPDAYYKYLRPLMKANL